MFTRNKEHPPAHIHNYLNTSFYFMGRASSPGLAACREEEVGPRLADRVDAVVHVNRQPDGARVVGQRARHRLLDPVVGVGREAAFVLRICEKRSTGHTHTHTHTHTHRQRNNTPDTDTHAHDKNNTPNPQTNTCHKLLTTLEGGATTEPGRCALVTTGLTPVC